MSPITPATSAESNKNQGHGKWMQYEHPLAICAISEQYPTTWCAISNVSCTSQYKTYPTHPNWTYKLNQIRAITQQNSINQMEQVTRQPFKTKQSTTNEINVNIVEMSPITKHVRQINRQQPFKETMILLPCSIFVLMLCWLLAATNDNGDGSGCSSTVFVGFAENLEWLWLERRRCWIRDDANCNALDAIRSYCSQLRL